MTFAWKTPFARDTFYNKYAQGNNDSWPNLARRVVEDVCGTRWGTQHKLMSDDDRDQLVQYIIDMKFIPGGRYLYYAGREAHFYNNCFCLAGEDDTREEWGALTERSISCLMSGGGIGVDYSIFRPSGYRLRRTGGISSGPIPLMQIINEAGRNVMQGGSRRSAIWAGLNWRHKDIWNFLNVKDWSDTIKQLKEQDFNFPAPLDMTNISILWDTNFLEQETLPPLWYESVLQMCKTGEPGHCYNFNENEHDTLRNACTEFTSDRDSDVCNLGSINFANIRSVDELRDVVNLASKFLVCGTLRADLPYEKVKAVREEYRKIGLGVMGLHEWLLQRGKPYEVDSELHQWFEVYRDESTRAGSEQADRFYLSAPRKFRAIAPAGTIGILASTTTGIEPLYSVAYKRRYLIEGTKWKYQYVVDATAERLIKEYGIAPENIETALSMSKSLEGIEKRIRFQHDVQAYVDMGISSTINLDGWGSKGNSPDTAGPMADILARYCTGLRGITFYPNGSRGGQPLTEVEYERAVNRKGTIFDENEETCSGGICGL